MAESFGVFGAVKGLFEYNRENFMFDRTMNQSRVYQTQKMRVAQVKLYRDDLRELFDLTIRKMDAYLIFNALLLLFTGGLFYEGQLPKGTPAWLLWLWTMSLGSAFFFLSLSVWFSIHASITAQTFQVRLLTQWLRLPIPSAEDIHAVAGVATDFEQTRAKDMLRVPGVVKVSNSGAPLNASEDPFHCVEKFPDIPNELLESDIVKDYTLFVEHFYLFRELQKHWQGFDAYCRVGMVVGTNMLLSAFSYMAIAYYLMSFKNYGALAYPMMFTSFQLVHLKFNLRNLTFFELLAIIVLNVLPVTLACIAGIQSIIDTNTYYGDILSPVMNLTSGLWVVFIVLLGSEDEGGLPTRFVTVASIDVLGLDDDEGRFQALSPRSDNEYREGADTPVAMAVPAAPVIALGEERRRCKSSGNHSNATNSKIDHQEDSDIISGMRSEPTLYGGFEVRPNWIEEGSGTIAMEEIIASTIRAEIVLPTIEEEGADAFEGIAACDRNVSDQIRAYKASDKARRLPWKNFREAGAVLVCLWLFATTYSVLASYEPRWGWPRTQPYGDGEEDDDKAPLTAMWIADHDSSH